MATGNVSEVPSDSWVETSKKIRAVDKVVEMRVLKDEEIKKIADEHLSGVLETDNVLNLRRDIAKAQDAKTRKLDIEGFIEWSEEDCVEHEHGKRTDKVPRKYCSECWQSLKDLL